MSVILLLAAGGSRAGRPAGSNVSGSAVGAYYYLGKQTDGRIHVGTRPVNIFACFTYRASEVVTAV